MIWKRLDSCVGFAWAFAVTCAGITAAWAVLSIGTAHGAPCVRCVQKAAVVAHYAAPVVQPYYYRVGAELQQQAADTYGFRNSAEWSEFLQLRGKLAGIELMLQHQQATPAAAPYTARLEDPAEGDFEGRVQPGGEVSGQWRRRRAAEAPPQSPVDPGPAPVEPPAPEAPLPSPVYPTLAARCASCHSGEEPKGSIWLDGTVDLTGEDASQQRDAIVKALWLGHMPPEAPASDADVGKILSEIYVE